MIMIPASAQKRWIFQALGLCFFLLTCTLAAHAQGNNGATLKHTPLVLKSTLVPDYVTEDVSAQLAKVSGTKKTNASKTIRYINRTNAPASIQNFLKGNEVSFWLRAAGDDITIYASSPQSFTNGLYQLLNEWGYRFYNYTDKYIKNYIWDGKSAFTIPYVIDLFSVAFITSIFNKFI